MDRAWEKARLYWRKWRWYEANRRPWNRARLHLEFARREAFVRMPVEGISVIGRNTQGVRLVNLTPAEGQLLPDAVAAVTRVVNEDDDRAAEPVVGAV